MADPFDTLGLPPRFDLDPSALERRHLELSKALHPDRYASTPAAERRLALGKAIEVNDAFRALRDPIRRADVLLARLGAKVDDRNQPKASPALLMEMMETREELSDAHRKRDRAAIERLAVGMRARREAVLEGLVVAFRDAEGDAEKLEGVARTLGELRYIHRFLDEASAIEEELAESGS
jgi:molecular chaperone HscB